LLTSSTSKVIAKADYIWVGPVNGDWVPKDTAHKATYEGMTYYFSSPENMEAFERRPHEFVTADGYLRKPLDEVRREAEVK